ncbi:nucleotidyltransferase [bacterium]|nr:nucleotidyltransferase [bacterium]
MRDSFDCPIPLILAGGRGTRISQLFPDLPKPAVPAGGKPFLVWILEQLGHSGFSKVVISGGHLFDVLRKKIEPCIPQNMEVIWVRESKPLGTGGAVLYAVHQSRLKPRRWLVMNGDSYLAGSWLDALKESDESQAWMLARKVKDTGRYGRLEVKQGELVAFREKQGGGEGLINAGIYLLPGIWLNEVMNPGALSMENDLIPRWLAEGRMIQVQEVDTPFLDIGTPEDHAMADTFFTNLKEQK